jgi:hypothetical protein
MKASDGGHARKRLLVFESLSNGAQDRHFALGPFDALLAEVGKGDVFDIVLG